MPEILGIRISKGMSSVEISDKGKTFELSAFQLYPDNETLIAPRITNIENKNQVLEITFEDGIKSHYDLSVLFNSEPDLLIINASQLLDFENGNFSIIENGAVLIGGGKIIKTGITEELLSEVSKNPDIKIIDACFKTVSPGLIDAHTHPVFAGDRSREFSMRLSGASYEEIQAAGGGIHNTVRKTREASDNSLFEAAAGRICESFLNGVTSCEAKSGYALNFEDELRSLRIIQELGARTPCETSPTLLAAHIIPREFENRRQDYIKLITDSIIPAAVRDNLLKTVDVFCEENAFTLEETSEIFRAASLHGVKVRVHAGQFNSLGAVKLAAEMMALSVDHLENVSENEFKALEKSETVAVLLPGAAFTLKMTQPDARKFISRGIKVALATDMNPGTSMTCNLPLMMSFGCLQMNMTVEQTWEAVTVNAAAAAGFDKKGRIKPGYDSDIVIWNFDHYGMLPYYFGSRHVKSIIKKGKPVSQKVFTGV